MSAHAATRRHAPTVLVIGNFGEHNPGGEALLTAFRRALRANPLIVASSDPGHTEAVHGVRSIHAQSWRELARAVSEATAVVLAGGTVFSTLPAQTGRHPLGQLRSMLALAAYARARGRMVLAVGVGVGRLGTSTARLLARKIAAQCDLLVLRDEDSAQLLAAAGVPAPLRVGADPVWTLLDGVPQPADRADRVVVVPSCWAVADAPRHLGALADALQPLLAGGSRVQVMPWQIGGSRGPDDRDHARWLAGKLPGAEILASPQDLADAVRTFGTSRLVVASRFHAAVAAAAAATPTLIVATEPKHAALAARLGQPRVPAAAPADDIRTAVSDALNAAAPTAAAVRAEIAAADEAFGLLQLMLDDGQQPVESISGLRLEPVW